jgi:uncharacterized repeat protein (TIGR01451 family)
MRHSSRLRVWSAVAALLVLGAHAAGAAAPADLRIRTTMKSFHAGSVGTYNIIVSNRGPNATDDVVTVTDLLPTGVSFVSGIGGRGPGWACGSAGALVTCTSLGPLNAPSISVLHLSITADDRAVGTLVNSITVAYAGDPNQANNTVTKSTVIKPPLVPLPTETVTSTPATAAPTGAATPTPTATDTPGVAAATDLSMMVTKLSTFKVGVNGVYSLIVTNAGSAATNTPITVTDELPNGLGFVAGIGTGWTCAPSGQTVTCTNPAPLAAGANTAITLTVSVGSTAYPTVTNVATVSYPGDTDPSNDTKLTPTTVRSG